MVRKSTSCEPANLFRLDVILATGVAIAILGIVQFFFFTSLAMTKYAGGSGLGADRAGRIESQHSVSYDWSRNFLSDLGREKAWSGTDNSVSARYFNGAVILLGIALVLRVAMAAIIVVTQTNHRNEQLAEQYLLKIRKHPRRREFQ